MPYRYWARYPFVKEIAAMAKKNAKQKFTFTNTISPIPMTQAEWEASEELLAELIARAIVADHPEWFGGENG
jgi:hypothetical protein